MFSLAVRIQKINKGMHPANRKQGEPSGLLITVSLHLSGIWAQFCRSNPIMKTSEKNLKIFYGSSPIFGFSNNTIYSQTQTGATIPLISLLVRKKNINVLCHWITIRWYDDFFYLYVPPPIYRWGKRIWGLNLYGCDTPTIKGNREGCSFWKKYLEQTDRHIQHNQRSPGKNELGIVQHFRAGIWCLPRRYFFPSPR